MPGSTHLKLWWLALPLLITANQACMKLLANTLGSEELSRAWIIRALHTPWVAGILLCEIASFVMWMRILSTVNISRAVPLTALAYILILLMGWCVFGEPVHALQIIGSLLILTGVSLIGTSSHSSTSEAQS